MHPRLSLHQVCMIEAPNTAFLDLCREAGIARAVLANAKLANGGLGEVHDILAHGGLRIESLNHVFCPDLSQAGEEATAALIAAIEAAATLGARSCYMLTGGRGALDWEQAGARFARLVAPALQTAGERGVALLIENASAIYADIHIAHSLPDTMVLAERAGIGICVELFHCWAEAAIEQTLRRAAPLAGLVQISDYVPGDRALPARAVPGDGALPLERLLGVLLDAGYRGAIDIELVGPRIVAEGIEAAARRAGERVSDMLIRLGA